MFEFAGNRTASTLEEADASNKPCRRDCFYYLATAHARLKNYNEALKHVKILLQVSFSLEYGVTDLVWF